MYLSLLFSVVDSSLCVRILRCYFPLQTTLKSYVVLLRKEKALGPGSVNISSSLLS